MRSLPVGVSLKDGLSAISAGLLGAAAFLPWHLSSLVLVSSALFLWSLKDRDVAAARNLGLLYGLVYGAGTAFWLFNLFFVVAIPLIAIFALYYGLLAMLVAMTRGSRAMPRALLVALFAVAVEWLRGDAWYLRFPWYTMPHALAAEPVLIAPVRWLGTYGFSFVLWFIAAWGAFGRRYAWLGFLLLPMGWFLLPPVSPTTHTAILVQHEGVGGPESLLANIPETKVDLVVLPEYAYFDSPETALRSPHGPGALARRLRAPVVFGAVIGEYGTRNFDNVAVVIDGQGQVLGMFPKQRPVPLFFDGRPGTDRPVFPLVQGVLGVAICYDFDAPEVAASLVRKGATVLVAPTFDAMHWGQTQHRHHGLLVRLRAVENNRWILRATSSGRTETVNPLGEPSERGIDFGKRDFIISGYGHCSDVPLGTYAAIVGPGSAVCTVLVLAGYACRWWLARRRQLIR